jgi:aconitate hydratase
MSLDRAKTEVAVQYVDHNLLQTDFKNAGYGTVSLVME